MLNIIMEKEGQNFPIGSIAGLSRPPRNYVRESPEVQNWLCKLAACTAFLRNFSALRPVGPGGQPSEVRELRVKFQILSNLFVPSYIE